MTMMVVEVVYSFFDRQGILDAGDPSPRIHNNRIRRPVPLALGSGMNSGLDFP